MYHVTTRALDQGGVEPRLAVSVRPEGHRQYHYTTAPDGKLAEPCSQDNIDTWGCGDGAAVVQLLSSLGVSYK